MQKEVIFDLDKLTECTRIAKASTPFRNLLTEALGSVFSTLPQVKSPIIVSVMQLVSGNRT